MIEYDSVEMEYVSDLSYYVMRAANMLSFVSKKNEER